AARARCSRARSRRPRRPSRARSRNLASSWIERMEPIRQIRSKTVVMPNDDIDTDQIIPARFLTTTTKEGLGKNLFNDWRYDRDGKERADFVLTRPENRGAQILVGGPNFGCGSAPAPAPPPPPP